MDVTTAVPVADIGASCDVPAAVPAGFVAETSGGGCCGATEPVLVGFPTGLAHGRSGEN